VKWNLSQGPMLALRERSVAILATERTTLIVVYKGVSFLRSSLGLQISLQWYSRCMLGKVLALSTLCAFVLLSALFQSTSPSSIHPLGILFVFLLIYVLVLGVLTFLLYGFILLVAKVRKKADHLSFRRTYLFASVFALAPIMIVGMSSIGRMGIYEFLLIMAFETVACFYVARQR